MGEIIKAKILQKPFERTWRKRGQVKCNCMHALGLGWWRVSRLMAGWGGLLRPIPVYH